MYPGIARSPWHPNCPLTSMTSWSGLTHTASACTAQRVQSPGRFTLRLTPQVFQIRLSLPSGAAWSFNLCTMICDGQRAPVRDEGQPTVQQCTGQSTTWQAIAGLYRSIDRCRDGSPGPQHCVCMLQISGFWEQHGLHVRGAACAIPTHNRGVCGYLWPSTPSASSHAIFVQMLTLYGALINNIHKPQNLAHVSPS